MKKLLLLTAICTLFCACYNDCDSCIPTKTCVRRCPRPCCPKPKPCCTTPTPCAAVATPFQSTEPVSQLQEQNTDSDWQLALKVYQLIMADNFLSISSQLVDVNVVNGVVTLSGAVSTSVESLVLEKKVKSIEGVKKVENKLTNRTPDLTSAASKPATLPSQQKLQADADWQLSLKIYQVIMADNFLSKSMQLVDIDALDGVVTLTGTVSSPTESLVLEKKVKHIEGVKKVENKLTTKAPELTCAAPKPVTLSEPKQQSNSDWQLTLKVYQVIMSDNFLSKSVQLVDINAVDGVVTLSGVVSSDIEARVLEKKVKNIEGVKKVENRLSHH
jgi:osmotically-inducible protein OsmY